MLRFVFFISIFISSLTLHAEKIPVENFFKFSEVSSVRISPNGDYLAAVVEPEGVKKLVILDIKNLQITNVFDFSRGKQEIGSYGWLNSSRIYASMVEKAGPLSIPRATGYLFAANIDGSKRTQLLPKGKGNKKDIPRGYRILNTLPRDDENILISMRDDSFTVAYKLNIYTGHKRKVEKSPAKYAILVADNSGTIRASLSQDPDTEVYSVHLLDVKTDTWSLFKSFESKSININSIGFGKDNNKYFVQYVDSEHPRGIYALDLETKELKLINKIDGDADISSYLVDSDFYNQGFIGFQQMPGYITTTYFDPKHRIARIHKSLNTAFPEEQVQFVNFTADGNTAVVRTYSDKNPGSYFLFDMQKFKLEHLIDVRAWIDRSKMAKMKPFSFEARDGLEIRGYLTLPNQESENLPMVVLVHGGPYGVADNWGYNSEVQFFANRGYAVLQVNFRGSGGRGGEFHYGNYRKVGKEMQNDITDATLWAIDNGFADKSKICIFGASYGGYASLMGAIREPDLYQCAIGYAGGYDIRAKKYADYYPTDSGKRFVKEAWGYGDEEFIKDRNVPDNVEKIKAALFLIHGKKDKRTPMENYESVTEALDQINYPYDTLLKPYEGHGFYKLENNIELYNKIEQFLKKHIGN